MASSHISSVVHVVHVACGIVQLRLRPLAYQVLLLDGLFQVHVGLLLDGLGVLQLLNQFHFQQLHPHHFLLLHRNQTLLFLYLSLNLKSGLLNAPLTRLFDLLLSDLFLDVHLLLAHLVLFCHKLHVLLVTLLVMHSPHFRLRCFFLTVHQNRLLNFCFLLF